MRALQRAVLDEARQMLPSGLGGFSKLARKKFCGEVEVQRSKGVNNCTDMLLDKHYHRYTWYKLACR